MTRIVQETRGYSFLMCLCQPVSCPLLIYSIHVLLSVTNLEAKKGVSLCGTEPYTCNIKPQPVPPGGAHTCDITAPPPPLTSAFKLEISAEPRYVLENHQTAYDSAS